MSNITNNMLNWCILFCWYILKLFVFFFLLGEPCRFYGVENNSDPGIIREVITQRKKRVIARWHMYVLLIKNPSLTKYRSHRVSEKPFVHEVASRAHPKGGLKYQQLDDRNLIA